MHSISIQLRRAALAVVVMAGAAVGASAQGGPASGFRSGSATSDSQYSVAESDFVVGKTVFVRSSKMRYGTIIAIDANHHFPKSFHKTQMKAVLIHRKDGPREWVPVERITRIYVVNKS